MKIEWSLITELKTKYGEGFSLEGLKEGQAVTVPDGEVYELEILRLGGGYLVRQIYAQSDGVDLDVLGKQTSAGVFVPYGE